jgi:hypothetical protein
MSKDSIKGFVFALLGMCSMLFLIAWGGGRTIKILGSTDATTAAVTVSSQTATSIITASTDNQRRGLAIYNNDSSDSVFLTTAAVSASNATTIGFPIPPQQTFEDNIEPYLGQWYGTSDGSGDVNVRVVEKNSSNY